MNELEKQDYLKAITGISVDNIFNPKLQITAPKWYKFDVEWTDTDDNYTIKRQVKAFEILNIEKSYPVNYRLVIRESLTQEVIGDSYFTFKNLPAVVFRLASQALGDQLIWIPQLEKWREENGIGKLIINSNWNLLYKDNYPNIEFIREDELHDYIKQIPIAYNMGLCLAADKMTATQNVAGRTDWRLHKLDHVMCDTVNIEKKAIKPKINGRGKPRNIEGKYVVITCNGSAIAKNWLFPNGWNLVIDYLDSLGYKVIHCSNIKASEYGVTNPKLIETAGEDIFFAINLIEHADFFIGLSSGNSWLSWALDKKVVMIAGLVDPAYEFQEDRYLAYSPEGKCHGCFTNTNYMWNRNPYWCPLQVKMQGKQMTNKFHDLSKAWECVRTIEPTVVYKAIDTVIEDLKTNTKREQGLMFQEKCNKEISITEIPLQMKEFDGFKDIDIRKTYRNVV